MKKRERERMKEKKETKATGVLTELHLNLEITLKNGTAFLRAPSYAGAVSPQMAVSSAGRRGSSSRALRSPLSLFPVIVLLDS